MAHGRIQALIDPNVERAFSEAIRSRPAKTGEKITKRQAFEAALLVWITTNSSTAKRLETLARAKIAVESEGRPVGES